MKDTTTHEIETLLGDDLATMQAMAAWALYEQSILAMMTQDAGCTLPEARALMLSEVN